jgi:hypothetical protein
MPRKNWRKPNPPPRIRQFEFWHLKQRVVHRRPVGRPPSPVPLGERRQAARMKYHARLAERGLVAIKMLLPADAAARLRRLARERGTSPGAYVAAMLPGP